MLEGEHLQFQVQRAKFFLNDLMQHTYHCTAREKAHIYYLWYLLSRMSTVEASIPVIFFSCYGILVASICIHLI